MKAVYMLIGMMLVYRPVSAQWNLQQCLVYAQHNNQELLAKQGQLPVAGLEKKIASAKFIPEVNAVLESSYYWKIPVQSFPGELLGLPAERVAIATGSKFSGNYDIQLKWTALDLLNWQDIKLQRLKEEAVQHGVAALEKLLLRHVKVCFYSMQIQRKNLDLSKNMLQQHARIHELMTQRFAQGVLDKIAFNQSASILAGYQQQHDEADIVLQKALLELKFWMGFPLEDSLEIQDAELGLSLTETVSSFSARNLPDYNEKESAVKIAFQQWQRSKYFRVPQLSLVSSFGQIGFGDGFKEFASLAKWHNKGFVGFQLRLPLWNPQVLRLQKRDRMWYHQKTLEFTAYKMQENQRFVQLQLELRRSLKACLTQQGKRQLAEENLLLCSKKIELGIIDMLQLQQIQQELMACIREENKAKLAYLQHLMDLNYLQDDTL
ncbi:TolC family protein [Sphingobacterium sp. Mn56C]|uniref:TolC family protein n=1 Tax=Sphingobacterium sp. Mn56C TaxID=3395261 RepID=UPI003BC9A08F